MDALPKLLFCGDNHGHFDHIIETVKRLRPDAVILLGDMEPPAPLAELLSPIASLTTIRWIHGNHCTDCDEYAERGVFDARFNLHTRTETIAGVRIAGLGGVFRGEIWYPQRRPPARPEALPSFHDYDEFATAMAGSRASRPSAHLRKHMSSIFPADCERLRELRADILVCHEAPSCHPHGFGAIDEVARSLGVRLVVHGHQHDRRDYSAYEARLGFKAFGVGFCGISDELGAVIVPGAFDSAKHRGRAYPKAKTPGPRSA